MSAAQEPVIHDPLEPLPDSVLRALRDAQAAILERHGVKGFRGRDRSTLGQLRALAAGQTVIHVQDSATRAQVFADAAAVLAAHGLSDEPATLTVEQALDPEIAEHPDHVEAARETLVRAMYAHPDDLRLVAAGLAAQIAKDRNSEDAIAILNSWFADHPVGIDEFEHVIRPLYSARHSGIIGLIGGTLPHIETTSRELELEIRKLAARAEEDHASFAGVGFLGFAYPQWEDQPPACLPAEHNGKQLDSWAVVRPRKRTMDGWEVDARVAGDPHRIVHQWIMSSGRFGSGVPDDIAYTMWVVGYYGPSSHDPDPGLARRLEKGWLVDQVTLAP